MCLKGSFKVQQKDFLAADSDFRFLEPELELQAEIKKPKRRFWFFRQEGFDVYSLLAELLFEVINQLGTFIIGLVSLIRQMFTQDMRKYF